ncbi:non-homologous end-joining DNA ligase [Scopulibacillus cellulosilyticus]|uniref:DNA ligase (ATP) n=1 Tax=Scopulibacillus cellulosilyticus TaxID=2665665 RepID=A0ABW2PVF9_9BACL
MKPIIPMEPIMSNYIPEGEEWIAQIKWDGVRVLTYYDGQAVRLFNRKSHERTLHYPELLDVRSYSTAESVIFDGEVIALGSDGKPSFHEVMRRDGIRRMDKIDYMQDIVPVSYMIFDVIYYNGEWINDRPFIDRYDILTSIIKTKDQIQLVTSNEDGVTLFNVIEENGMEGIVMKRKSSPYIIGQKREWVKIKNYQDLIAVIGGFTLNNGIVNAIMLGLYDQKGHFIYIGHTGTGKMTKKEWRQLTEKLKPMVIKERPFYNKPERSKGAYWIRPELTVKIKYAEWTEGGSLRQPSIEGFVKTSPEECIFND